MPKPHRSRRWPLILIVLLAVGAGLWTALWHYGAGVAERTIDGWKAREAASGRVYTCASLAVGGFPFGLTVHCADAGAELKSNQPPLAIKARDMLVSASVWRPTVLTTEFGSPLTLSAPGEPPALAARWQHAEAQLHGLPTAPESASIRIEGPVVDRTAGGDSVLKAARFDLDGRMVSGTVADHPVIELTLKLTQAAAPAWHPAAAIPLDADITAVVRGLADLSPKPWPDRLRAFQAAGGRIDITKARVQQRDTLAVAEGTLGLSPAGRLTGELRLTVANLEALLPALGLDRMLSQEQASPRLNEAFGRLDRIMPGLGNLARQNAGPALVAGINAMGQPTQLEGRRAVILPLRFDDGLVSLGPLKLGMVPPLF
ncbi:MAG TPA: DUF2125 domain-containing protein [Xanthobacteraceae bacterium]|jgi:hypothetical protein|nr:DUF2125 domain-containing protein [Xanthobacteraceae bacterium]